MVYLSFPPLFLQRTSTEGKKANHSNIFHEPPRNPRPTLLILNVQPLKIKVVVENLATDVRAKIKY